MSRSSKLYPRNSLLFRPNEHWWSFESQQVTMPDYDLTYEQRQELTYQLLKEDTAFRNIAYQNAVLYVWTQLLGNQIEIRLFTADDLKAKPRISGFTAALPGTVTAFKVDRKFAFDPLDADMAFKMSRRYHSTGAMRSLTAVERRSIPKIVEQIKSKELERT